MTLTGNDMIGAAAVTSAITLERTIETRLPFLSAELFEFGVYSFTIGDVAWIAALAVAVTTVLRNLSGISADRRRDRP